MATTNDRTVFVAMPSSSGMLVGIAGTVAGKKFPLSAGTFMIGRDAECELALSDEPGVSRQHTKIVAEADDFIIVDCESRNGTLVNGKPVQRARLKHGDVIQISGAQFSFQRGAGEARVLSPPVPAETIVYKAPVAKKTSGAPSMFAMATAAVGLIGLGAVAAIVYAMWHGTEDVVASATPAKDVAPKADASPPEPASPSPSASTGAGGQASGQASGQAAAAVAPPEAPAAGQPAGEPVGQPSGQADGQPPGQAGATATAATTSATAAAATTGGSDGGGDFQPVTVESSASVLVRIRANGKVSELLARDGVVVDKGAPLVNIAADAPDRAAIATLKESIAALEEIAKNNERAAKQLAADKAELARLQGAKGNVVVKSPASGTVVEMALAVGDTVQNGQVVARIQEPARVKVKLPSGVSAGPRLRCALQTQNGVVDVDVVSSTSTHVVLGVPRGVAAESVTGARCR